MNSKLTQKQLAKAIGKSQQFISLVLSGKRRPHYKTAIALERFTGISQKMWLEGSPDEIRAAIAMRQQ